MSLNFKILSRTLAEEMRDYHADDFKPDSMLSPPRSLGGSVIASGIREFPTLEDFGAMITGCDPDTGMRLTPRQLRKPVISGLFTFPKSVSGLLPFDDRLIGLVDATGRICVDHIEAFAFCRNQASGSREIYKPSGIAAVVVNHGFSDAKDPHLHPHIYTPCAAFDPERAWRNLWTSPLIENRELISARCVADVAVLIWKLGYDFESGEKSPRIRGFPKELEAWWSSRGNSITTSMYDEGINPADKKQRKRQAKNSRQGGAKPDTSAHLEALRNSLPPDLLRQMNELVKDARGTARMREGADPRSVDATCKKLEDILANDAVVPAARAEIQVLRALPTRATRETFKDAVDQLHLTGFSRGRHEFLVSTELVVAKAAATLPEAPGRSAPLEISLPKGRAIEFVASGKTPPILVCEVKGAARFCEETLSSCSGESGETAGRMEIVDVSHATLPEIDKLIAAPKSERDRLILVTKAPSREYCSVASALAEPMLPGYSLPVLQESSRKRARPRGQDLPADILRCVATLKDISGLVHHEATNGRSPLIVTQTSERAEQLNQQFHEEALRRGPTVTVDWFETMPPASLPRGESAFAFMRQGKSGVQKGSIVPVYRLDDRFELAGSSTGAPVEAATWAETHAFVLLKKHAIMVTKGEPIFRHSGHDDQSIPLSPARPAIVDDGPAPIAEGLPPFWSFGYAAPLAMLPDKGLQAGIIVLDEGQEQSERDQAKLRRLMHDSPVRPMHVELVVASPGIGLGPSQLTVPVVEPSSPLARIVDDLAPEM